MQDVYYVMILHHLHWRLANTEMCLYNLSRFKKLPTVLLNILSHWVVSQLWWRSTKPGCILSSQSLLQDSGLGLICRQHLSSGIMCLRNRGQHLNYKQRAQRGFSDKSRCACLSSRTAGVFPKQLFQEGLTIGQWEVHHWGAVWEK